MSFGFGVGDILATVSLAHRVYTAYREAPSELRHLSDEVLSLHSMLEVLRLQIQDPDSVIFRSGDAKTQHLTQQIAGCNGLLQQLEDIYKKYQGSDELWRRAMFYKEDLDGIRQKLMVHLGMLQVSLTIISQGSHSRESTAGSSDLLKPNRLPSKKKLSPKPKPAAKKKPSASATSKKPAESTAGSSGLSKPVGLPSEKKLSPKPKSAAKKKPSASVTSKEPVESTAGSADLSKPTSLPSEEKLSPEPKPAAKKKSSASATSKKPAESTAGSSDLSKPTGLPSEKKLSPKPRPVAKKTSKAVKFAGSPSSNHAPATASKKAVPPKRNSAKTPKAGGAEDSPRPKRGPGTALGKSVPKVQTPNGGSSAPKISNSTTLASQPPASPPAETAQRTPHIRVENLPYASPDFLRGLITVEAPVATERKRNASPSATTGRITVLGYTHGL